MYSQFLNRLFLWENNKISESHTKKKQCFVVLGTYFIMMMIWCDFATCVIANISESMEKISSLFQVKSLKNDILMTLLSSIL